MITLLAAKIADLPPPRFLPTLPGVSDYSITPRRSKDGFTLRGEMLGGSGEHWFREIGQAESYAALRAGMESGKSTLKIFDRDGTLVSEKVLPGGSVAASFVQLA